LPPAAKNSRCGLVKKVTIEEAGGVGLGMVDSCAIGTTDTRVEDLPPPGTRRRPDLPAPDVFYRLAGKIVRVVRPTSEASTPGVGPGLRGS
jgi:hypothetical protein